MSDESVSAETTVEASTQDVFAVVTDPSRHAGIDGTGWVAEAVDGSPLRGTGDRFQMAMFHPDHPDGTYETVNEVIAYEQGRAVAWRTGYVDDSGAVVFAGWWWRYDLVAEGPRRTRVTLTHDWSDVGPGPRAYLSFPVFGDDHLDDSLRHLSAMLS
ncbi:MAG: hypothetical protein Q7T56_06830 [Nocardioidaceae bacterium]|nr:hypothetical protein [Nocardioidaceae bacterium]